MTSSIALTVGLMIIWYGHSRVHGHGRLVEPPSRSSMWRFGFKTRPNYNDNELFCGGYTVHFQRNKGKCGVCGDSWDHPSPRPNEAGGKYGRGIIVRRYSPGQVITSTVELTANHRGFFEFKLCPHNSPTTVVKQECLDQTPLELADGGGRKYYPSFGTGAFKVKLQLPQHLTCSQCVFQWTYTAGNNWGQCENGTSKVGCGPQETFRGCADVSVGDSSEGNDISPFSDIPSHGRPSISSIPPRKPSSRPNNQWPSSRPNNQWPRPRKPTQKRKPPKQPAIKPYYVNRGPMSTKKPSTKRPTWGNYPRKRYPSPNTKRTTLRPRVKVKTTSRPWYPVSTTRKTTPRYWYANTPKKTTYRPWYTNKTSSPKPRPTKKTRPRPKPTPKKAYDDRESENTVGTGCRAVGAWQSVSGIASWCDVNCARGYCPSSHCDCS